MPQNSPGALHVACVQMHRARPIEHNVKRTEHVIELAPNSKIFHCVANTAGQSPDGKQTSSGASFLREPSGIPLAGAGYYQEEMLTAALDMLRADRSYILDSMNNPPFLSKHWQAMIEETQARAALGARD
jgi:hypothetical protein